MLTRLAALATGSALLTSKAALAAPVIIWETGIRDHFQELAVVQGWWAQLLSGLGLG